MSTYLKTFDSGLRLVFQKVEKDKPASINIGVNVGSYYEKAEIAGMAHFIEHMAFKGTKKYPDAKVINIKLEESGISANAWTGNFSTCFVATTLNEKMEECFEILSELVLNPIYDEEAIKNEKKVVIEEISMYQDDPNSVVFEGYNSIFFKGTSIATPVIGNKENIKSFTRKQIIDFFNEHYIAKNIVVSVCGHFDNEFVEKLTQKYFNSKFNNNDSPRLLDKSLAIIPKKDFEYITKDVNQAQIIFGFPITNIFDKNVTRYSLICMMFGAGRSSRLFQKIREENGFVYAIDCWPVLNPIGGSVIISFGTNEDNIKNAMNLIRKEMDLLVEKGFTQEEFDKAKVFCKSLLLSSNERTRDIAYANVGNILTFNKVKPVKEKIKNIEKTTLQDLNKLAKKVFNYKNVCGCAVTKNLDKTLFEKLF